MARQQEILEFTLEAGRVLLANGGEIFRVQETMQRIAKSYGAQNFNVYVLTNGLFASLKGDEGTFSGEVRSVNVTNIHLKRIVAVNELSRAIERGGVPLADAFCSLRAIETLPGLAVLAARAGLRCGRRGFCVSVRRHSAGRTGRAAGRLCAGSRCAFFLRGAARTDLLRTCSAPHGWRL